MLSEKKSTKIIITEKILYELSIPSEPLQRVINDWWYTKSTEGLRLTMIGDEMFRKAEIQFFDLPLPKSLNMNNWHSFLINCSRKLKCPYYIGLNKNEDINARLFIRLYDDKIAVLVSLYGDITSYLESVRVRK
jgi:hypothetical protein